MKVFWSWQSDTPGNNNHFFVRDALTEALKRVAADLNLDEANRPEIDHDTKDEPGLVSIVDTIFGKIDKAAVFVADLTYVGNTEREKKIPNPNVMIELGYALKAVGPEHIILVANEAYGGRPEDLPFDLRHRRAPITYNLPPSSSGKERERVRANLVGKLADALAGCLGSALKKVAEFAQYPCADARADDPSIWLAKGAPIQHLDYYHGPGRRSWEVIEAPRFYIRVIPAKYDGSRHPRDIQDLLGEFHMYAPRPWSGGDGGVNSDGVVAVGLYEGKVLAASQWFKKTSEIWAFHGGATFNPPDSQNRLLAWPNIVKGWRTQLKDVLGILKHIGVNAPLRVEVGVVGLEGAYWSNNVGQLSSHVNSQVRCVREDVNWDDAAQLSFVAHAFNQLAEAFNQRSFTLEEVRLLANDR